MAEKQEELTVVEIRRRMERVEAANPEPMKAWIEEYLASRLTQASLIGRAWSVSDPRDRAEFAEWFVGLMDDVYRYATVKQGGEGSFDPEAMPDGDSR